MSVSESSGRTLPRHVAVIMDGNGRWAKQRGRPRALGHRAGVRAARAIVRAAHRHGVQALTLFAFSQENWGRPQAEVGLLMELFVHALSREIASLHRNGVRLRFIGDRSAFPARLTAMMEQAEAQTAANPGLILIIAAGYGGQWDIVNAARQLQSKGLPIDRESLESQLACAGLPHPDLLIRTGGEKRISNFMLWQLAYAELFFTDVLWPDFDAAAFADAMEWYAGRQRRFGQLPDPVACDTGAEERSC